jgi:hypothetical protein
LLRCVVRPGYDVAQHDFPFLLDRAAQLKIADFDYLGRDSAVRSKLSRIQVRIGFPRLSLCVSCALLLLLPCLLSDRVG